MWPLHDANYFLAGTPLIGVPHPLVAKIADWDFHTNTNHLISQDMDIQIGVETPTPLNLMVLNTMVVSDLVPDDSDGRYERNKNRVFL